MELKNSDHRGQEAPQKKLHVDDDDFEQLEMEEKMLRLYDHNENDLTSKMSKMKSERNADVFGARCLARDAEVREMIDAV